ncbi:hypothetical protein B0I71DRAFT_169720 [Yarrowia lipolytica]|uniref:Uncharacterized protein n=1 Tax=Yarrowia lipolytica TaxID=4952 RepID=A0A371BX18_YARLL|nr:hypothetical protein B0I71DRAFT_169720 [Yarrowia lipolytica]
MKLSSAALVAFAAPVIAQQTTNTYATTTITSMHTVTATLTCEPSDYVTSTRTLIEYEDDRCIVNNFVYSHCKFLPPSTTCPPEFQTWVTKTTETESGFSIWTTEVVVMECLSTPVSVPITTTDPATIPESTEPATSTEGAQHFGGAHYFGEAHYFGGAHYIP